MKPNVPPPDPWAMRRGITVQAFVMAAALVSSQIVVPPSASGAQASGCTLQIARSGEAISSLGAVVSDVVIGLNQSPHNPFPGKDSITFRVGSLSASKRAAKTSADLMNSPALQARLAKQLFAACADLVEVRFNMTATDWDSSMFRGENGSAIQGTCVDPGQGQEWPLWGYYHCL